MAKRKRIIGILIGAAAVILLSFCVLYYNACQFYRARELCSGINPIGWEKKITYEMLSPALQEIITEEEFTDPTPEVRLQMYQKLEGLVLDDRPVRQFDGSTEFYKTPYREQYEIDGTEYFIEFRIDVKCRFQKMEVRNFVCYISEQPVKGAL